MVSRPTNKYKYSINNGIIVCYCIHPKALHVLAPIHYYLQFYVTFLLSVVFSKINVYTNTQECHVDR